eukprot:comp19013_c0_seq1/m.35089 comp19013_c0_seq1/g.35089  ORF comp19013_c0_seq1/g.35089 comp19013_c0_seq1/m.35089 type:complete len:362 (-) comp19013_c0_seq1:525-1610(-)
MPAKSTPHQHPRTMHCVPCSTNSPSSQPCPSPRAMLSCLSAPTTHPSISALQQPCSAATLPSSTCIQSHLARISSWAPICWKSSRAPLGPGSAGILRLLHRHSHRPVCASSAYTRFRSLPTWSHTGATSASRSPRRRLSSTPMQPPRQWSAAHTRAMRTRSRQSRSSSSDPTAPRPSSPSRPPRSRTTWCIWAGSPPFGRCGLPNRHRRSRPSIWSHSARNTASPAAAQCSASPRLLLPLCGRARARLRRQRRSADTAPRMTQSTLSRCWSSIQTQRSTGCRSGSSRRCATAPSTKTQSTAAHLDSQRSAARQISQIQAQSHSQTSQDPPRAPHRAAWHTSPVCSRMRRWAIPCWDTVQRP